MSIQVEFWDKQITTSFVQQALGFHNVHPQHKINGKNGLGFYTRYYLSTIANTQNCYVTFFKDTHTAVWQWYEPEAEKETHTKTTTRKEFINMLEQISNQLR